MSEAASQNTSIDFDVEIVHNVDEIGRARWDKLAADTPFAGYRWYRFGEAVMAEETPIYIILSHAGEPVARATFWITRREPLPISSKPMRRAANAVMQRWPLMLCRSPLSNTSGLILPDPPLRNAALQSLIRIARQQARQHRVSFLIFDFLEPPQLEAPAWPDGFAMVDVPDPGTRLRIEEWPDFESYLQHLSSKTRKNYRRNCRQAADLGVEIRQHESVPPEAIDDAVALIRNVEANYDATPNPWMRGMLAHAGMVDSVWLAAEIAGRLVGCELMLGDGGMWMVTALGRDYEIPYVYFVLGYADIERAIQEKGRVLRWGSGAYDTKRRLGFEHVLNNHMKVTANNPALRWLTYRLAR